MAVQWTRHGCVSGSLVMRMQCRMLCVRATACVSDPTAGFLLLLLPAASRLAQSVLCRHSLDAGVLSWQPADEVTGLVHELCVGAWSLAEGVGHKRGLVEVRPVEVARRDLHATARSDTRDTRRPKVSTNTHATPAQRM